MSIKWSKIGLFAAGILTGTAGVKILTSKDAKKVYAQAAAAALRGKDCVMETYTKAKENAGDILAEAKDINAKREEKAAAETIQDSSDETSAEA